MQRSTGHTRNGAERAANGLKRYGAARTAYQREAQLAHREFKLGNLTNRNTAAIYIERERERERERREDRRVNGAVPSYASMYEVR